MRISSQRKKEIKDEFKKILKQLKDLGAKKIILFGSLARDKLRLGSDIDLIVIFQDKDNFKSRMRKIYDKIDTSEGVDILAYNFEEFERVKNRAFFRHILKEGKVVYEAKS